jgi:hypothetical protein
MVHAEPGEQAMDQALQQEAKEAKRLAEEVRLEARRAASKGRKKVARDRSEARRIGICQFCGMHEHEPCTMQSCSNYNSYCGIICHATNVFPSRAEEDKRSLCINKDAADYKV